jgi:2,3-bisphosphoglycerate-independent phosphoglycerate mutase
MPAGMKYVVIVGDGMADYGIEGLNDKTPLMVARTPHMDWLAKHGEIGLVRTIPEGFTPGSEIANLSIFGYDPHRYYTGRGPFEAASLGVRLDPKDIAFRCNLVTLQFEGPKTLMEDFSAGHISDEEARRIIIDLDREMGTKEIRFYPGVSYRHLMVFQNGAAKFSNLDQLELTPPHDITGKEIAAFLPGIGSPEGSGGDRLLSLMNKSQELLKNHPVNLDRKAKGLRLANSIWLWGQGRSPRMTTLGERFGIEGYVISAVHLLKGIGILAGLEVLEVPGATGYFDTNYEGKAEYALKGLKEKDFVYVHVEAPDEAGHMGDLRLKIEMIETFDEKIVGAILKGLKNFEKYRVLVLPDHPTPLSIRTHAADPVPYVIYSSDGNVPGKPPLCLSRPNGMGGELQKALRNDSVEGFDEATARKSQVFIERGFELIERFLRTQSLN